MGCFDPIVKDVLPFFEREPNKKTRKSVLPEIKKHLDFVCKIADKVGNFLSNTDVSRLDRVGILSISVKTGQD
jgi:hypothetical protein